MTPSLERLEICPRCHRRCLFPDKAMNALSHIDNKTYICSECGTQSGLCDMDIQADLVEINMHDRFKKELKTKRGTK